MIDIKCTKCGNEMTRYENFIQLENSENVCESCFFDIAIEKLNAKEKQIGLDRIIDTEEDREEFYNSYSEYWD